MFQLRNGTLKNLGKRYFKKRVSEAGIAFLKKRVYFRNRPENVKACTFWGQTSQIFVSPRRNRQKTRNKHHNTHTNAPQCTRNRQVKKRLRVSQAYSKISLKQRKNKSAIYNHVVLELISFGIG